jgi:hypothetical protein
MMEDVLSGVSRWTELEWTDHRAFLEGGEVRIYKTAYMSTFHNSDSCVPYVHTAEKGRKGIGKADRSYQ